VWCFLSIGRYRRQIWLLKLREQYQHHLETSTSSHQTTAKRSSYNCRVITVEVKKSFPHRRTWEFTILVDQKISITPSSAVRSPRLFHHFYSAREGYSQQVFGNSISYSNSTMWDSKEVSPAMSIYFTASQKHSFVPWVHTLWPTID
jgi:hypothetical protein